MPGQVRHDGDKLNGFANCDTDSLGQDALPVIYGWFKSFDVEITPSEPIKIDAPFSEHV